MGQPQVGRMVEGRCLVLNSFDDLAAAVAVNVCPDRGVPIEIALAVHIEEPHAFAPDDHQRSVIGGAPLLLTGEGMPTVGFVCGDGIDHDKVLAAFGHSSTHNQNRRLCAASQNFQRRVVADAAT